MSFWTEASIVLFAHDTTLIFQDENYASLISNPILFLLTLECGLMLNDYPSKMTKISQCYSQIDEL